MSLDTVWVDEKSKKLYAIIKKNGKSILLKEVSRGKETGSTTIIEIEKTSPEDIRNSIVNGSKKGISGLRRMYRFYKENPEYIKYTILGFLGIIVLQAIIRGFLL